MNIRYTEEKCFTPEQVQALFRSVGWVSGEYPSRLHKALMHSSTVLTAWDGERLVGLVRVLDDSEMVAYMHYVLVHPDYHGQGIAGTMIEQVKAKYRDFCTSRSCRRSGRTPRSISGSAFGSWRTACPCSCAISPIRFEKTAIPALSLDKTGMPRYNIATNGGSLESGGRSPYG